MCLPLMVVGLEPLDPSKKEGSDDSNVADGLAGLADAI